MNAPYPVVLTIAGYDPSSGAGVTADIKTIAAHGCFGVSCITALTVQSTAGVQRFEPVSVGMVRDTLSELAKDMEIAAVHVGMLGSAAVGSAVADFLEAGKMAIVVVDPVLKASSGTDLTDEDGIEILRARLLPLATAITPNLEEAAALTGGRVESLEDMRAASARLHLLGAASVVITGGHLDNPVDLLSSNGGNDVQEFPGEKINSGSTHGTGCAFATALSCQLALGKSLPEAVRLAGRYVRDAIASARPVGKGRGPVNHFPKPNRNSLPG